MLPIKATLDLLAHGVALLGVLPLFPHLELPAQILFVAALSIGLWADRRGRHPLPPVAAALFSLAAFLFYAAQVRSDRLVEPAINLLVLVLAARLVLPKSGRDYLQILLLGIFALAASSLLSVGPAFILFLLLQVPAVILGLVLLTFHAADEGLVLDRREVRRLVPVCLLLPTSAIPLLLFFYAILPRTSYPVWHFLNAPAIATAALAETVRPGAFAGLTANTAIAFRAESRELPKSELYWRGIVLNTLEGNVWTRRPPPAGEAARVREGLPVRQTIFPEPRPGGYLVALDLPRQLEEIHGRQSPDLVHTAREGRRVHYQAVSAVNGVLDPIGAFDRAFYLQVPAASPRVREAAARIAEGSGDREKLARLETFLQERQLVYATTDLPGPADPVDIFLFEKRRGYCEYFAAASGVLLRLAGVPTRLVGGYLGGDYSRLGGYYTVTEEMAHVWVEALVDGREWVRFDPSRLAVNAPSTLIAARERQRSWGRTLLDAADFYWMRAVVTYDLERQIDLLRRLSASPASAPLPGRRLFLWLGSLAAAGTLFFLLRRRRTPEERLLHAFLRRIGKLYALPPLPPGTGLHDLAARLPDPRCAEFAEIYGGAVFRDRPLTPTERRHLSILLRELRRTTGPGGERLEKKR